MTKDVLHSWAQDAQNRIDMLEEQLREAVVLTQHLAYWPDDGKHVEDFKKSTNEILSDNSKE